jgi:hypothetical protein
VQAIQPKEAACSEGVVGTFVEWEMLHYLTYLQKSRSILCAQIARPVKIQQKINQIVMAWVEHHTWPFEATLQSQKTSHDRIHVQYRLEVLI